MFQNFFLKNGNKVLPISYDYPAKYYAPPTNTNQSRGIIKNEFRTLMMMTTNRDGKIYNNQ